MTKFTSAPIAERRPFEFEFHGQTFTDPYQWIKTADEQTLNYIKQENEYTDSELMMPNAERAKMYQGKFHEIESSRIANPLLTSFETNGYTYVTEETPLGSCLFRFTQENKTRELVINWKTFSAGMSYFQRGFLEVSPSARFIAFSYDDSGAERFKMAIVDTETGAIRRFENLGINLYYSACWCATDYSIVATAVDELGIPRFIYLLNIELGVLQHPPILLFEETAPKMTVGLSATNDHRYILICSRGQITTETRIVDPHNPSAIPILLHEREIGVRYTVEHHPALGFLVLMGDSDTRVNNVLYQAKTLEDIHGGREGWIVLVPHSNEIYLTRMEIFSTALVVWSWKNAVQNFAIYPIVNNQVSKKHWEPFKSPSCVYSLFPAGVRDQSDRVFRSFDSQNFTFTFSSYLHYFQLMSVSLSAKSKPRVVAEETFSALNLSLYAEKKVFVPTEDGQRIPMSIVYRKQSRNDSSIPKNRYVFLRAYGAYGGMIETMFNPLLFPLLDEGFIIAFAHIRGDADNGYKWYLDGKFDKKYHSFEDFATCLRYIHAEGWSEPSKIAIFGRSAGGLVMGATITRYSHLFNAAILNVPYVDVIGDMIDRTVPWTLYEWQEWGNPNDPHIFEAMKDYSPYENVSKRDYPHALFIGGLRDGRVGFYEPARMVAKMRHELGSEWDKKLYLRIHEAGHFSASQAEEFSMIYTFIDQTTTGRCK